MPARTERPDPTPSNPGGPDPERPAPHTRAPRRLSADNRRDQIMQAAAQLFIDRGFESVSMADLAAHLQTSRPTIYTYFPSTTAILGALFQERLERVQARLGPHVRSGQPVYRDILALLHEERDTVRLLGSGGGPQFQEQRQQILNVLRTWIMAEAPTALPATEREWLLNLVIQLLLTAASDPDPRPHADTLHRFIEGGLQALRHPAPRTP